MSDSSAAATEPRVAIVAEHASAKFGGEAILPLHYFRRLRARGVEAWLVVHERTRDELGALLADDLDRVRFVPDSETQKVLSEVSDRLPPRIGLHTATLALHMMTEVQQRRIVRELVAKERIDVVHVPIPVSPRTPSILFDVGAPVVFGPMNGGMDFPEAFRSRTSAAETAFVGLGRAAADVANRILPGKRRAAALLVANARTREALPRSTCPNVIELVENGVDVELFAEPGDRARSGVPRFVFVGRLVDWKGVDMLIDAVARARRETPIELEILGEGEMRPALEAQVREAGLSSAVHFRGFVSQATCATTLRAATGLVLPSLYECGGAVVLEAMATGLPVIANAWGGPADYLDDSTGILVEPRSREHIVASFAGAMVRLARDPALCARLGRAAHAKVREHYDWERKIDRILDVYRSVLPAGRPSSQDRPTASV